MKKWYGEHEGKLKPISKAMERYCYKNSAKYIFVENKEGQAFCSSCDEHFVLNGTTHKQKCVCPSCKREMEIQHTWRMSKDLETHEWYATAQALDNKSMVIRYVLAYRKGLEPCKIEESARMYVSEEHAEPSYSTYHMGKKEWQDGKNVYFRIPCYCMPNNFFCMYADVYRLGDVLRNAQKLDCFKYYPVKNVYVKDCMISQLHYLVRSARVNEKLSKVGFENIERSHRNFYMNNADRTLQVNLKKTDLLGMLKMDKTRMKIFKETGSLEMLYFLQSKSHFNLDLYEYLKTTKYGFQKWTYNEYERVIRKANVSVQKMVKYIEKQKISLSEYDTYLCTLKKLGYDLKDTSYTLPKDFRKEDDRVSKEWQKKVDEESAKKLEGKSLKIKAISEALRKMPNLKEFMDGSRGLMVYVPESASDLMNEGRELHNCIGTYVDRVASNQTMVFFIRQLDNPTAPFVAMEYCHGQIIQCRYDHNRAVEEDSNIYSFAEGFAKALREANVLAA